MKRFHVHVRVKKLEESITFFKALLDISREIALEIYEKKKPEFSD